MVSLEVLLPVDFIRELATLLDDSGSAKSVDVWSSNEYSREYKLLVYLTTNISRLA